MISLVWTALRSIYDRRRIWGRASKVGDQQEPVTEASGYDAGKAGIAILRNAGIDVEVLGEDEVHGAGSQRERDRLELRNKRLNEALKDVDQKLAGIKKG